MSNILPIRDFPLTQNVNAKIDMDVAFKKDIYFFDILRKWSSNVLGLHLSLRHMAAFE